jgi:mono/diheme cytochrome c family protein
MKKALLILVTVTFIAGLAGVGAILGGLYDVSALQQHLRPTYRILDIAMRRSIGQRAEAIPVPPLDQPGMLERGLALFDEHCVQCHGAPGVAPAPFALGLQPAPANLAFTAREWPPADIFWTVQNGIKMTGMPAWEFRLSENELWAVVAFVMTLPELSPAAYKAMSDGTESHVAEAVSPQHPRPGDPERGRRAILNYACVTCHHIPGIVGPNAPVGPPLDGIGSRAFIAGVLPNGPGQMERWLREPQRISPLSAMPDLGVDEEDARDMAAYLANLK